MGKFSLRMTGLALSCLFLLAADNVFSQDRSITVTYHILIDDYLEKYGATEFAVSQLTTNGKESIYTERLPDTSFVGRNGVEHLQDMGKMTYQMYKDLQAQAVLYQDRNQGGIKQVISHKNYRIQWSLTDNVKEILGYRCQEAKGRYGCREYTAYFALDIPLSDGPYKFDGLPGLILEVISDDGTVTINATKISQSDKKIENTFTGKANLIDFEASRKKYQLRYEKMQAYMQSQNADGGIPKRFLECYVD